MSSNTEKAYAYLSVDTISHIDMLEPIRRGSADILYAAEDGVVLYERKSEACMIAMDSTEACKAIVDCTKYSLFAVHQSNIADWIQGVAGCTERMEVYQAVYEGAEISTDFTCDIRALSQDYAELIAANYGTVPDLDYIETLLDEHLMFGIFDGDALAGFIGEHLEGSMGLLEVLPAYRRQGYGYKLQTFLIHRYLEQVRVPFCQVVIGNEKSLALQKKLGMRISTKTTTWLTA